MRLELVVIIDVFPKSFKVLRYSALFSIFVRQADIFNCCASLKIEQKRR